MPQIPQLQIPQMGAVSGGVDFAPLANLGNIYNKARQDEANKAAIAAFQQTGDTRALMGSGDMSLIKLGTELEQQKAAQAFREKSHADTVSYQNRTLDNTVANQNRSYDLQKQTADRANLNQPYQPNPAVPGGVIPTPGNQQTDPVEQERIAGVKLQATLEHRKRAAKEAGYVEGSPEYQAYVLTGKEPQLSAFGKKLAGEDAERLTEYTKGADSAGEGLATLDYIEALRDQAYTGPLMGSAASAVGHGATVAMDDASKKLALEVSQKMKGSLSDKDIPFVMSQVPGIRQGGEAGKTASDIMRGAFERGKQRGAFFRSWAEANNNLNGADEAWQRYIDENPLTTADPKALGGRRFNPEYNRNFSSYLRGKTTTSGGGATTPPPAKTGPVKWDDWLRSGNK